MYCQNCGTKLNDTAKFCENCGTPTSNHQSSDSVAASAAPPTTAPSYSAPEPAKKPPSSKPYMRYADKTRKSLLLVALAQILSVLFLISFVALPIFSFEYEPRNIEEWSFFVQDTEDLGKYLTGGTVKENFSLIDEFLYAIDHMTNIEDNMFSLFSVMFLGSALLAAIIGIIVGIMSAISTLSKTSSIEIAAADKYNQVKNPTIAKIFSAFRGIGARVAVVIALSMVTVLLALVLKNIEVDGQGFLETFGFSGYIASISGVALPIAVAVGLLAAIIVVYVQYSKIDKEITKAVLAEDAE